MQPKLQRDSQVDKVWVRLWNVTRLQPGDPGPGHGGRPDVLPLGPVHPHDVVGQGMEVDAGQPGVRAAGGLAKGAEQPLDEVGHDVDDGLTLRALQVVAVRPTHRYGGKGQLLLVESQRGDLGQNL